MLHVLCDWMCIVTWYYNKLLWIDFAWELGSMIVILLGLYYAMNDWRSIDVVTLYNIMILMTNAVLVQNINKVESILA